MNMFNPIASLITICYLCTMMMSSSNAVVVGGPQGGAAPTGTPTSAPSLAPSPPTTIETNVVVVSQDPNTPGAVKTINEALMLAPLPGDGGVVTRFVIHVMAGTYPEYVTVKRSNVTMFGDGIGRTIITGNHSVHDGFTTSESATLIVEGEGFIGKELTVQNTAGTLKGQAVAMRVSANHAAFYKCSFEGYQDTLYPKEGNQFYRECHIYGTIDFIFSLTGRVVLQDCDIYVRDPRPNTANTITADGREVPDDVNGGGICIHHSKVLPTAELLQAMAAGASINSYLGRPWKNYSRTVFMNTYMDGFVDPAGWSEWAGAPPETYETLYYAEYHNCGDGAATVGRVKWHGYNRSDFDPSKFTVAEFIDGNSWLPDTGVPFYAGLDEEPACPKPPTEPYA